MRAVLAQLASISIIVFGVSSMLSVGLAYRMDQLIGPLREGRAVFRALLANFVLVPLLAIGIERMIPLDPPVALGLILLAGSAGAPFLIKLTSAAGTDLALGAALLLLLIPATVVFLPFYVPFAMTHPSWSGLSYAPSSSIALGVPLLSTLLLPIVLGLGVKAIAPRWAARLVPIGGKLASVSLVVVIVATFGANYRELIGVLTPSAVLAGVLMTAGAFVVGFMLSRHERSVVLGLGTAQRNIAGAMVIASRDFNDPSVLVMVTGCSLVSLLVLFPIASLLSRRAARVGLPTPKASPA